MVDNEVDYGSFHKGTIRSYIPNECFLSRKVWALHRCNNATPRLCTNALVHQIASSLGHHVTKVSLAIEAVFLV